MNSTLLMPRQDKFYRAVIEDIKDRQDCPSGITKEYLHILFEKRLYNYLSAGLFNFYFSFNVTQAKACGYQCIIISDVIYLASKFLRKFLRLSLKIIEDFFDSPDDVFDITWGKIR